MVRVRLIDEIKDYALSNNVPIMKDDTIEYIKNLIIEYNTKDILEIGTAIGYSTICFRQSKEELSITSIERDKDRYDIAVSNTKKSKLSNIELIFGDALETPIKGKYDMIIIDASKAQKIKFLEKYKKNLSKNGIIIFDNILFHGLVGKSEEIKSKNLRALVKKIEMFLDYLKNQDEFFVKYLSIGDGLAICKR